MCCRNFSLSKGSRDSYQLRLKLLAVVYVLGCGLRTVLPRIDVELSPGNCREQWAMRLEAISVRLRVLGGEDSARAVSEFDAKIKAWRARDESDTRMGFGCIFILTIAIIVIFWWLFRRIWPA